LLTPTELETFFNEISDSAVVNERRIEPGKHSPHFSIATHHENRRHEGRGRNGEIGGRLFEKIDRIRGWRRQPVDSVSLLKEHEETDSSSETIMERCEATGQFDTGRTPTCRKINNHRLSAGKHSKSIVFPRYGITKYDTTRTGGTGRMKERCLLIVIHLGNERLLLSKRRFFFLVGEGHSA